MELADRPGITAAADDCEAAVAGAHTAAPVAGAAPDTEPGAAADPRALGTAGGGGGASDGGGRRHHHHDLGF
jgi:hypothetical protein